jgi:hypothetical protein
MQQIEAYFHRRGEIFRLSAIAIASTFEGLLADVFDPIRSSAIGNVGIMAAEAEKA